MTDTTFSKQVKRCMVMFDGSGQSPELYVQVVPLNLSDQKRLSKNNHHQRIKVSNGATLATLASYVQRLADSDSSVSLHAPYGNGTIQMPLSISVAEFFYITNQHGEGELRYSFKPDTSPAMATHHPMKLPRRTADQPNYPPPLPVIPLSDSIGGLMHSGFSIFSNSFGVFPTSPDALKHGIIDGQGVRADDSLSLRQNLELEIMKQ
jgi:hypothetical protein